MNDTGCIHAWYVYGTLVTTRLNPIVCRTYEGLCNRINAIASSLTTGRPVELQWAVNSHCPVQFEDVFALDFGMTVANEAVDHYPYCRTHESFCWFYPQNIDQLPFAVFQQRMHRAYRLLLEGMKLKSWSVPVSPALGISYRHHLKDVDGLEHFWSCVKRAVNGVCSKGVHLATDSQKIKDELLQRLLALNVDVTINDCKLLAHDFDRSLDNVLGMCSDLRSLASCQLGVITNSARTTTTDPLRGFGVRAYSTTDDRRHRSRGRDHLYVPSPIEDLIDQPGHQFEEDSWNANHGGNNCGKLFRAHMPSQSRVAEIVPSDLHCTATNIVRTEQANSKRGRPVLSLCMIVRDSAETLYACLRSISPWVDEIVVVDTGSVDQSSEIARRFAQTCVTFNGLMTSRPLGIFRWRSLQGNGFSGWMRMIPLMQIMDGGYANCCKGQLTTARSALSCRSIAQVQHQTTLRWSTT